MVWAEQGECLEVLETVAGRGAGEMVLLHTPQRPARQRRTVPPTVLAFLEKTKNKKY
jgi:hypothetical protein